MSTIDTAGRDLPPDPGGGADDRPARAVPGALVTAAIASLGAGAIHATATGAHSEHRSAAIAFAVTAALQIGWGALALVRSGRLVSLIGVAVNGAALGGWVLAKTVGIGFVDGLDVQESAQFADTLAAVLAGVAVAGAVMALLEKVEWAAKPRPALVGVTAAATLALAVNGMVATGTHGHAGGEGHTETAAGGDHHGEGGDETAGADHHGEGGDETAHAGDHGGAEGEEAASTARPYDATLPVDLGGFPGVTAAEQAEAEDIVTITLEKLPQWADVAVAEAAGYRSIRDGATGTEHFMKWDLIDDGKVFDPDFPESLVYEVGPGGERTLVAAMFMANQGTTLETVPPLGGDLIQWHIHNDLCFAGEAGAWVVAGIAPPDQECRPGTMRLGDPVPMVHVWIKPHPCGPFAALEGVGGGQIPEGETRLCDEHHGAPT